VRGRKIVQDLDDFSHVDATLDWQYANLAQWFDLTVNVVVDDANGARHHSEEPWTHRAADRSRQGDEVQGQLAGHTTGNCRGRPH
jgi:hypothetical protein